LSNVFYFNFNNVRGVLEHFVSPFFSTEKGDFWHEIVSAHFVDKRLTDFVDVLESSILFVGFLFSEGDLFFEEFDDFGHFILGLKEESDAVAVNGLEGKAVFVELLLVFHDGDAVPEADGFEEFLLVFGSFGEDDAVVEEVHDGVLDLIVSKKSNVFLHDEFGAWFSDVEGKFGLFFEFGEFEIVDEFVEFLVVAGVDLLKS
jgi:hypothetical protein